MTERIVNLTVINEHDYSMDFIIPTDTQILRPTDVLCLHKSIAEHNSFTLLAKIVPSYAT